MDLTLWLGVSVIQSLPKIRHLMRICVKNGCCYYNILIHLFKCFWLFMLCNIVRTINYKTLNVQSTRVLVVSFARGFMPKLSPKTPPVFPPLSPPTTSRLQIYLCTRLDRQGDHQLLSISGSLQRWRLVRKSSPVSAVSPIYHEWGRIDGTLRGWQCAAPKICV